MRKSGDVTFYGTSGKPYNFEVYSTDTAFPDVGAVYIYAKCTAAIDAFHYEILYVGETSSLLNRIIPNRKKPAPLNNHAVNAICIHLDADESSRLLKEKDLIELIGTSRFQPERI